MISTSSTGPIPKPNDCLFVDREYLASIAKFVHKGKTKIRDDRYKYSTKNLIAADRFQIEDIFENDTDSKSKLSQLFIDQKREQIRMQKTGELQNRPRRFYYNKHHEFMHLNDFLEFYDKYMEKRIVETEKLHYKRKFLNEVDRIKEIKKAKFMETETLKLGGSLTSQDRIRLEKKLKKFVDGLEYAIQNMSYKQAEKMLRKLNTIPQPPLKTNLGSRTRLYRIKTGGNMDRALGNILDERKANGTLSELGVESSATIKSRLVRKGDKYGQFILERMQGKINHVMNDINEVLANKRKGSRRARKVAKLARIRKSVDCVKRPKYL